MSGVRLHAGVSSDDGDNEKCDLEFIYLMSLENIGVKSYVNR